MGQSEGPNMGGGTMNGRGFLHKLARIMGDANAVKKGRVGKRVARRAAGRTAGKGLRRLFT